MGEVTADTAEAMDVDTRSCPTAPPEGTGEPMIVTTTTHRPPITAGMVNMAAGTDTMTTSLTVTAGSDTLNKVRHSELFLPQPVSSLFFHRTTSDTEVAMEDTEAAMVDMVGTVDMVGATVAWKWHV